MIKGVKFGLKTEHIEEIKQYLKALDLIVDCPIVSGIPQISPQEHILFVQPRMRYCQAQALVHSLLKDDTFMQMDAWQREMVTERILEEVRGRMLEDIVLLETYKALGKQFEVFKMMFDKGEFDMVIYDSLNKRCAIYEIKHSKTFVKEQARHLMNPDMLARTTPRFGKLVGRFVLYLGESMDSEEGIAYRNAEEFLKQLPKIELSSGLEKSS